MVVVPFQRLVFACVVVVGLVSSSAPTTLCPVNISLEAVQSDKSLSADEMYTMLNTHNNARIALPYVQSMPLLAWSHALADEAFAWASRCDRNAVPPATGFNLAIGTDNVSAVASRWRAQGTDFVYGGGTCAPSTPQVCGSCTGTDPTLSCNAYIQMVWAATLQVGCAKVACSGSQQAVELWVMCTYSPRGLVANEGPYTQATTALVGCQYPTTAASDDDGSNLKIFLGVAAGVVMTVGGGAYLYLDGGDGCCCGEGSGAKRRASRRGVYDEDAYDQLNVAANESMLPPAASPDRHVAAVPIAERSRRGGAV